MEIKCDSQNCQKWLFHTIGILVALLLLVFVVDKGYDFTQNFKSKLPQNTISMSAEGKVSATPDLATLNLGVITKGATAAKVQDENSKKINQVIKYLKDNGIEEKDITTSSYSIYPDYEYKDGRSDIIGYQANQTVTVKIHNADKEKEKIGKVIDGATNNGVNQVNGVYFSFDDVDDYRNEARKLAVENAKVKARELAEVAGLKLGKVVSIAEGASSYYPEPMYDKAYATGMGGGASSVAPEVQPGTQDITENITVVFEVK
jgi:hypothetical protein